MLILSQVVNIQSFGRLRNLLDSDVKFCYIYSSNIVKQKMYYIKIIKLFKDRVATIFYSQRCVGIY